jgi:hypothetical protein
MNERKSGVTATEARPSSIGEILDRAIATYVKRFVPLFIILALLAIPIGILSTFVSPVIPHMFQTISQLSVLPPGDTIERARIMQEFNRSAPGGWLAMFYLIELIFYPLARTALVVFAAGTLDGAAPTIASAYREALRRWVPQLVVLLAFLTIALMVGIGLAIAGGAAALAIYVVALFSRIAATVAGVAAYLVLFAVIIVVVALGYIAWLMASVSVAVEDANPVRAIGRGLRRTFDRSLRKRTLAVALAVLALQFFGSFAIIAFAGLVAYLTHQLLLNGILGACAGIVLDGVSTVFVLLYMRDVALRREGSDLLLAIAEPSTAG